MNCLECQELVQHWLDGLRSGPDRAAADHLEVCTDCRELHAAALRLTEGLRLYLPAFPPPGLARQISSRVLARHRRVRRFRRVAFGGVIAASLVLAVLVAQNDRHPGPGADDSSGLAVARQPAERPPSPSLQQSLQEAGLAVVSLTQRTADETVGQGRLLLPGAVGPTPPSEARPTLEPSAQSLRELTQSMTAGLEPVATSARRAVDLFLREIPPRGAERKPGT